MTQLLRIHNCFVSQDGFSAGTRCDFNFANRGPRALLTGAGDEGQPFGSWSDFRPRRLNHFEILIFIEMHSFAGGTEQYVAADPGSVPLGDVCT